MANLFVILRVRIAGGTGGSTPTYWTEPPPLHTNIIWPPYPSIPTKLYNLFWVGATGPPPHSVQFDHWLYTLTVQYENLVEPKCVCVPILFFQAPWNRLKLRRNSNLQSCLAINGTYRVRARPKGMDYSKQWNRSLLWSKHSRNNNVTYDAVESFQLYDAPPYIPCMPKISMRFPPKQWTAAFILFYNVHNSNVNLACKCWTSEHKWISGHRHGIQTCLYVANLGKISDKS